MGEPSTEPRGESSADLGIRLSDLWYAERCGWHINFDGGAHSDNAFIVELEWTQEHDNAHQADWITYTWQFYGDTAEEALRDAVEWCEGLVPFEQCGACGGEGEYNTSAGRATCEECAGSGLAHHPAASSSVVPQPDNHQ